jgi:hypothetical protein
MRTGLLRISSRMSARCSPSTPWYRAFQALEGALGDRHRIAWLEQVQGVEVMLALAQPVDEFMRHLLGLAPKLHQCSHPEGRPDG